MSSNSFGKLFHWTSFGESHGTAMGVVIEGCPAGMPWNPSALENLLARRRPGQKSEGEVFVSERNEADSFEILSGVFEEKTLGTPIALLVRNKDQRSKDYEGIKDNPRMGHADDTWKNKFGHVDYRGGGRASARETVSRILAGGVAKMLLHHLAPELSIYSYVDQIGPLSVSSQEILAHEEVKGAFLNCPVDKESLKDLLSQAKTSGESYGGSIVLVIDHPEKGLGQPVFNKLKSDLASGLFSIGASMSVELGAGHKVRSMKGTELHVQSMNKAYGGIRGGISTGEQVTLRISFKPTSSIKDVAKKGRHDPCIVPRACPVVESMAWTVLADHLLWKRLDRSMLNL